MCGILGGYINSSYQESEDKIKQGLFELRHRGPNDSGYEMYPLEQGQCFLGHTRLSIIDLSTDGHQPMVSHDRRYKIVFNGEIYNYKELRKELINLGFIFKTQTDTEVLLTMWQHLGEKCLVKLKGMFVFAVFDSQDNTLTCVRDAFGIKPFFYTFESGSFLFASEIRGLRSLKKQALTLNIQRAYDYLVHGVYDSNDQTFYQGIYHLLPATIMKVSMTDSSKLNVQFKTWWKPNIDQSTNVSFDEAKELVRNQFLENVKLHLRSDVPVAAALSGGIDSSAIVCTMRYLEPDMDINTYSFIAQNHPANEEKWVNLVNNYVGAIPNKIVLSPGNLIKDLDQMINAQGEPFGSTSIYAQYKLFEHAKSNGITVSLEGQGADELLGGYDGYPGAKIRSLLDQGNVLKAYQFIREWSKYPDRSMIIGLKNLISDIMPDQTQSIMRQLNNMPVAPDWIRADILRDQGVKIRHPKTKYAMTQKDRRVVAELINAVTQRGLIHLLRHSDRNSMAFSIESRVPFLTTDMAELMFSLPENYLVSDNGETKHVFRHAMRGIVPDEILFRKDKIGFVTPEIDWFINNRSTLSKYLQEDLDLDFIDQKGIYCQFNRILDGEIKFSWQAWRWINFSRWYQLNF